MTTDKDTPGLIRIERDSDGNFVPVYDELRPEMNVIRFEPRRQPAPTLQYVEIRLNEEDCSLTLSAHDDAGNIVTFEYTLTSKSPETFRLEELRAAWDRWRGSSTKAS